MVLFCCFRVLTFNSELPLQFEKVIILYNKKLIHEVYEKKKKNQLTRVVARVKRLVRKNVKR